MVQLFMVVITLLVGGPAPPDAQFEVEVTCTNTQVGTQSVEFGPQGGTDQLDFGATAAFEDVECTVTETQTAGAQAVEIDPAQFSPGEPPTDVVEVIVRNTFAEPIVPVEPVEPSPAAPAPAPVRAAPAFTG